MRCDDRRFSLTPKVLDLGHSYVSSLQLADIAQPFMEAMSERVHESVSVGRARRRGDRVRGPGADDPDHDDLDWRSGPACRRGARPLGRVLLAELPAAELDAFLARTNVQPLTDHTLTGASRCGPPSSRSAGSATPCSTRSSRSASAASRPSCATAGAARWRPSTVDPRRPGLAPRGLEVGLRPAAPGHRRGHHRAARPPMRPGPRRGGGQRLRPRPKARGDLRLVRDSLVGDTIRARARRAGSTARPDPDTGPGQGGGGRRAAQEGGGGSGERGASGWWVAERCRRRPR